MPGAIKYFLFGLFSFFSALNSFCQEDTTTIGILNKLAYSLVRANPDSSISASRKALDLSEKISYEKGMYLANLNLGKALVQQNKYTEALIYYTKALQLARASNYKPGEADIYLYISEHYKVRSKYADAVNSAFRSLEIYESLKNRRGMAHAFNAIANVYYEQSNYAKAQEYYLKAVSRMDQEDQANLSVIYLNLGLVYSELQKFDSSRYFFDEALKIRLPKKNKQSIADVYTNMGVSYSIQKDYTNALKYFLMAKENYSSIGNKLYLGIVLTNIGDVYMQMKKYTLSEEYLLKALAISSEIDDKEGVKTTYATLSNLYAENKRFEKAFEYHSLYTHLKDSLMGQANQNEINEIQTRYETDKRDRKIELLNKDKLLQESIIQRQRTEEIAFTVSILLLSGILFLVYRGYRQKKRDHAIISSQKLEVEKQKQIIENQKKDVEEKQKEILDSIHYAKRIQSSLLPTEKYLERIFKR